MTILFWKLFLSCNQLSHLWQEWVPLDRSCYWTVCLGRCKLPVEWVAKPYKCFVSMITKVNILKRIALNFSLISFSIIVCHVQKLTCWKKKLHDRDRGKYRLYFQYRYSDFLHNNLGVPKFTLSKSKIFSKCNSSFFNISNKIWRWEINLIYSFFRLHYHNLGSSLFHNLFDCHAYLGTLITIGVYFFFLY